MGEAGGTFPAVYNAANEVCVDAFHERVIRFTDIVDTVEAVVDRYASGPAPDDEMARFGSESATLDVAEVLRADRWARAEARRVLGLAKEQVG